MNISNIVYIIYILFSLYVILITNTLNLNFLTLFPALVLLWLNFILFYIGYKLIGSKEKNLLKVEEKFQETNFNNLLLILVIFYSFFSAYSVVHYYTGQTPFSIIENISNGVSVYYEYQRYFMENNRNVFSFTKLPFVFMLFSVKFITLYSYMHFSFLNKKQSNFYKFYLFFITMCYLYIGVGRGTSFEFFEIGLAIIFVTALKLKGYKLNIKKIFLIGLITIGSIFLFYEGLELRGVTFNNKISDNIYYDENKWLSNIPILGFVVMLLFNYFGFGYYYLSTFIDEIWFSSYKTIIGGLLPYGIEAITFKSIDESVNQLIDTGVRWQPDSALFINNFGLVGLYILCIFMGVLAKLANETPSPMSRLTQYFILLQMISLPIGKFVVTSSASQLILLILIIFWLWKLFVNKKIVL